MTKKDEAAKTTEVAQKQATNVALQDQFLAEAGAGFEEASAASYAIPFLQILQSGSPQCKKSEGAYIKGAEEGMIYNTVTQELFDGEEGVLVIPCHYTQRFVEWQLRESGGGFVKEHLPGEAPSTVKDEKGRDIASNGNAIVDTRNHYVLIKGADGSLTPALIAMSSTQLKKSKQWMSKMQGIKIKGPNGFQPAPMMSRVYKLTTIAENNDKGAWMGWRIELAGLVDDPAEFQEALSFRAAVKAGSVKAAQQTEDTASPDVDPESF